MTRTRLILITWNAALLTLFISLSCYAAGPPIEEFVGPFTSWANVKTDFGAVGDGKADDTAAIQKALYAVRSTKSPKEVLYFPNGTYRITATVRLERVSHQEPLGMSIIGEDPAKTVIRWDGPVGKSMFLYNAWYASLSRITFDGAGKAKTGIEHGPKFTTANEFTDIIIRDVEFGIEAGQRGGIAETAVLRCRFYRCARAAISIQNFNSLDWYIWNCWFEDCGIGVTNEFGAGNFHVYSSTFLRSKDADITIGHTGYFSFVGNRSIGSRRFFHARRPSVWKETETWGSQATLQENVILDPTDATPIVIENNGPNMILDNIIRVNDDRPIIRNVPPAEKADLIVIGNRWTARQPVEVKGRVTDLDNTRVKASAIRSATPSPAPFAAHVNRLVIEVPSGADTATLQAAINKAAKLRHKRPVIHLSAGKYNIRETLVIPSKCNLQLMGDGPEGATMLIGAGADPVIQVQCPSHVTFRSFLVNGGNRATGAVAIQVVNCDQHGARIFGEQLNTFGFEYGFVAEGLRWADVELHDAGHNGMQVIGSGQKTASWIKLFAGASSRGQNRRAGIHLYDVQRGAKLFVRDIWYEGTAWSLIDLKGRGEFALHSAFMAAADPNHLDKTVDWEKTLRRSVAAVQFDGFDGKVALTLFNTTGTIRVVPPNPGLQLYLLGLVENGNVLKDAVVNMNPNGRLVDLGGAAVKGRVVAEHVKVTRRAPTGLDSAPGYGRAKAAFIRRMLKPLRTLKPQPLTELSDDVTNLRFYRVWADGRNGIRIQAKQ